MRGPGVLRASLLLVGRPLLLTGGALVVGLPAAPAYADPTPVPGHLTTASVTTSSLQVPVPAGVTPHAITGRMTMAQVVDGGTVAFRVNGHLAATVASALDARVQVPVEPADVVTDADGHASIALTMVSQAAATPDHCLQAPAVAQLSDIALVSTGAETPPTSAADFLPPASAELDVLVPSAPDDDVLEAGLSAVAALASRYPAGTPVLLDTSRASFGAPVATQRVVSLVPGSGAVTSTVSTVGGVPTLTLTGERTQLADAARALAQGDSSGVAGDGGGVTTAPSSTPTVSLADLTASGSTDGSADSALQLRGPGSVTERFVIRQDRFGGPVSALALHLVGTDTTPSPDVSARIDVRLNDTLVGSQSLDGKVPFQLDLRPSGDVLRGVNLLDVTLSVVPAGSGACDATTAPVEVDLDTTSSSVTATAGTSRLTGFEQFPQMLRGTLPVALVPQGAARLAAASDAARLISALQGAATRPLDVQLVSTDVFLADERPGLLVGATDREAEALGAPLPLASVTGSGSAARVPIAPQTAFAALESVDAGQRRVLMLGGWAPTGGTSSTAARAVADAVDGGGWDSLGGEDLLVTDGVHSVSAVDSGVTPAAVTPAKKTSYVGWFVAVIALVVLLLAYQAVMAVRRRPVAEGPDPAYDDAPLLEPDPDVGPSDDEAIADEDADEDADEGADEAPDEGPDEDAEVEAETDERADAGDTDDRTPSPSPSRNRRSSDQGDAARTRPSTADRLKAAKGTEDVQPRSAPAAKKSSKPRRRPPPPQPRS